MPYYNRDPKRDPNFDNHPYSILMMSRRATRMTTIRIKYRGLNNYDRVLGGIFYFNLES